MTTYFISDLHLSANRPELTQLFLKFLADDLKNADALYILGDLFEMWIGDDNTDPHNQQVMDALAHCSQSGIPLYFMHGNRDFLIGNTFAQKTQCVLLKDPSVVLIQNEPVLLTHGDLLCTLDTRYQRFRRFVRQPWVQVLFLKLPLSWRQKIAKRLRQHSSRPKMLGGAETIKKTEPRHWDVALNTVFEFLRTHQTTTLIHGHTHKPKIHEFLLDNHPAKRIVLGDWGKTGSVLCFSTNEIALKQVI